MTGAGRPEVGYRGLADAIPGCVAVQVGEELRYVSDELAAMLDASADALTGESWRAAFGADATQRLERGIQGARADGEWRGDVTVTGGGVETAVGVTLRQVDGGALAWLVDEATPGARNRARRDGEAPAVRPAFARTILDVFDDVVYVIDESGEFNFWNDALVETTGYSHEELADMTPKELIPEDQHEYVPGLMEAISAIEDRRVDVDILAKDGERVTHEFTGTTFEDPDSGERFRCGIARDVTRQRERERDLERYETIVETVNDGVYVLDEDLRFAFVNQGVCDLVEMPEEDVLGTPVTELFALDDERELAEEIRQQVVSGNEDRGTVRATVPTSAGERVLESRYQLFPEPDTEFRGSVGVIRDVTEREARTEELRRQRTLIEGILNTIPDVVFAFDEAGEPIVEEAMLDEFAGYTEEELADIGPFGVIPEADRQTVIEQIQRVLTEGETVVYETSIVAKDGSEIPHEFRAAPLELDGDVLGVVGSARDITARLERERAIARQRDELATLDRINRLLLEATREVIQSASRDAVERAVCERLAASDLYKFAWVGEREFDGDRIVPRASAGEDDGYLDSVTITATGDETGSGPAGRAMRTGDVQVADVTDPAFDTWQEAASDRGFRSVAAVPLHHGDTVYGVLAVYATREGAFSPREQDGFDVLGRSVGAVIHAARSRELLFADAVVELSFEATGGGSLFQRIAGGLDCTLTLDGYVAAGEQWILYVAVEGAQPDGVVEAAAGDERVERARVVSEADAGGRVELVVGESLLHAVSDAGASVKTASATADAEELVIEAPANADVRQVVKHVQAGYPGASLVASKERDREITTVGRPGGLLEDLTDRQREAVEAAYRAGYFAWPRESTAEEVAASLSLAAPTLHGHLRKAEQTLLSELFDAEEPG